MQGVPQPVACQSQVSAVSSRAASSELQISNIHAENRAPRTSAGARRSAPDSAIDGDLQALTDLEVLRADREQGELLESLIDRDEARAFIGGLDHLCGGLQVMASTKPARSAVKSTAATQRFKSNAVPEVSSFATTRVS